MTYMYHNDGEAAPSVSNGFAKLLEELQSGDCMVVERLEGVAPNGAALLALLEQLEAKQIRFRSIEENFDTGTEAGKTALRLFRKFARMDAGEKAPEGAAKEDAKAKGRKPIEVDEEMFDSILERWKNGEITARQAMAELNLKPNTFYRRVKERMPDAGAADSLLDAAKKLGKDIVTSVSEGTGEIQQAAERFAADHDMGTISNTVKKNITAAGAILGRHIDSLSRDFQDAVERYERRQQEAAQGAGEPVPQDEEVPAEEPAQEPTPAEEPAPEGTAPEADSQPEGTEYL